MCRFSRWLNDDQEPRRRKLGTGGHVSRRCRSWPDVVAADPRVGRDLLSVYRCLGRNECCRLGRNQFAGASCCSDQEGDRKAQRWLTASQTAPCSGWPYSASRLPWRWSMTSAACPAGEDETMIVIRPKSSEEIVPLVWIDGQVRFGCFLQWPSKIPHLGGRHPFGLWIRVPFLSLRWGCA